MSIADHIAGFKQDLIQIRHQIHAHPELGLQEHKTAALVALELERLGIETHRGIGGTGVVGVMRSGNDAQSVGLRADMDALPIQEAPNALPYRSTVAGISHASGHDGHTTILLGVARYLAETRRFQGVVNLIFQPAEEGLGGAVGMLEDGLFERFPCDTIYALHNLPMLPVGKVAMCRQRSSAGGVFFDISITGKGAHAASPHLGTNPVLAGCQIVTALHTLVAQRITALEPAILSVTRFQADGGYNIIPGAITLSGTIRAHSRAVLERLQTDIKQTAAAMAAASGCTATSSFRLVFAPLLNDPDEVAVVTDVAVGLFGSENVNPDKPIGMGSEDFAFMLEQRPGAHFFVGNGENSAPVHNGAYDFNDDVIVPAAALMAAIVERKLA